MLQRFLSLIKTGQYLNHQELASALHISPGLVLVMVADLEQKGYLQTISSCVDASISDSSCDDCSSRSGCLLVGSRQGWILTEKGEKAAASSIS